MAGLSPDSPPTAIERYSDGYNGRVRPFVAAKAADQILTEAIKHQLTSGTLH